MQLEEITWDDAWSEDGWKTKAEIISHPEATVRSVGWVIHETKRYVYLASSTPTTEVDEDDVYACTMVIPKGMIIKRRILPDEVVV